MNKEACRADIDHAIVALQTMRETLDDPTPGAAINLLEAALKAHDSIGRAILQATLAVVIKNIGS